MTASIDAEAVLRVVILLLFFELLFDVFVWNDKSLSFGSNANRLNGGN